MITDSMVKRLEKNGASRSPVDKLVKAIHELLSKDTPAPVVKVEPALVSVTVPKQETPKVTVQVPQSTPSYEFTVKRDSNGLISKIVARPIK